MSKNPYWLIVFLSCLSCNSPSPTAKTTAMSTPSADASSLKPAESYNIQKIESHLLSDRPLTENAWSEGKYLTDFRFPWQDKKPPLTRFVAAYTADEFHFAFEVEDKDLVLAEGETQALAAVASDRVELFFACNDSLNPYYSLEMDPRAWVFSSKGRFYRQIDASWKWPGLKINAEIKEGGYTLWGKIPLASFAALGLWQNEEQNILTCAILRAEFSHIEDGTISNEWISWQDPKSKNPDFHIPSAFGKLIFTP